jgi:L-asparaginase / beta-aspartyl-peptidase
MNGILIIRKYIIVLFSVCTILLICTCRHASQKKPEWAIAIHGGAGAIHPSKMSKEKDSLYRMALSEALSIGEKILADGESSLDAVEQTIIYLEDSPLFNAGRGAVFTHEGKNELDASIMDGNGLKAGAVGSIQTVKNPIKLARTVMEKSPHVFLIGKGAETFAYEQGIDTVSPSWFYTEERWKSLQQIKQTEQLKLDSLIKRKMHDSLKFGTVGCVALDKQGNLSAGTSTGGMTNKRWNRIGDVPVIGAGTYADNSCCAISCTGHGEYFIRYAVAHDLYALIRYAHLSLEEAGNKIIHDKLVKAGGDGGLIAIDTFGNIIMPFNTDGMFRASSKPGSERQIKIYKE